MTSEPKYPNITVRPVDGNAFSIIGATTKAMRNAGVDSDVIEEYRNKATSGDYNHLLRTTMEYVNIETEEDFDELEEDLDDDNFLEEEDEDDGSEFFLAEDDEFYEDEDEDE